MLNTDKKLQKELITYLLSYVTENKQKKMEDVLAHRTNHVVIGIENIFQSHNANAIMRSAECFGLQQVHVIEDTYRFSVSSGVAMGATKWLDLYRHRSTASCFDALRQKGYRIIATSLHPTAQSLYDLPLDKKMAFIFGTENSGISEYGMKYADEFVTIPMYGFTSSFNVSVSVALTLQHIMRTLHQSAIPWQLNESEQNEIMLNWLRKTVRAADLLEKEFLARRQSL